MTLKTVTRLRISHSVRGKINWYTLDKNSARERGCPDFNFGYGTVLPCPKVEYASFPFTEKILKKIGQTRVYIYKERDNENRRKSVKTKFLSEFEDFFFKVNEEMGGISYDTMGLAKGDGKAEIKIGPNTEYLKKMAFISVVLSTVATLISVLCLPMIYTYAQRVHSSLQLEMDSCQVNRK